ncbi:MAG TPA: hypothetical protein PKH39_05790 [Woeseiaceae bacterium]|nr:hypothetical protein [Woeseiaceae bacterium]
MRQSTLALLLVLGLTLFGAWFLQTHHKVVDRQFVGYSGEARYNDFLAAELLLREMGIEADSRASLTPSEWLPYYHDTIVSRTSESIAIMDEQSLLLDWILNGGHLVLLPPRQASRITDEFIQGFGARFVELEHIPDEDEDAENDATSDEEFDYFFNLSTSSLRVEVADANDYSATLYDEFGYIAARRSWGSGYVTLIADDEYFLNRSLGDEDHARFLLDVVAGYVPSGKVWFVLDSSFPALWQLIWNNAAYAVVAAAAALMLWLWSVIPKFGPAIEPAVTARRSILEHVSAAGHFAWRHHGTASLARSSIDALLHDAEIRHPDISRMSPDNQARALARLSDIDAQTILAVLLHHNESRHREFANNIQALQKVRKRL